MAQKLISLGLKDLVIKFYLYFFNIFFKNKTKGYEYVNMGNKYFNFN